MLKSIKNMTIDGLRGTINSDLSQVKHELVKS